MTQNTFISGVYSNTMLPFNTYANFCTWLLHTVRKKWFQCAFINLCRRFHAYQKPIHDLIIQMRLFMKLEVIMFDLTVVILHLRQVQVLFLYKVPILDKCIAWNEIKAK